MRNDKHTSGPWVIDWNVSRLDVFSSDAATLVATLRRSALSGDMDARAQANARLIAAAPEMYEALCRIANLDREPMLAHEVIELAKAAIAKAGGQQ